MNKEIRGKLIVALDVDNEKRALEIVDKLKDQVNFFKIGLELFTSCGPDIVAAVKAKGCDVFLDLKFHDIPNTAAKSTAAAARLGVSILNVHALGGYDMMKRCAESIVAEAKASKIEKPRIIAVTILTSMEKKSLKKIGINDNIKIEVLKLAKLAKDASLDGVVASPSEVKLIRRELGEEFIIVTPGVRPSWAAADDQKRIATPKEAILNGASYIVVGRPVIEAADPAAAAKRILEEIK